MEITPKLVEQTRRWVTRAIYEFHHSPMAGLSGEKFEKWHEDKAKDLLTFINMPEQERAEATKGLHIGSCNSKRVKLCE